MKKLNKFLSEASLWKVFLFNFTLFGGIILFTQQYLLVSVNFYRLLLGSSCLSFIMSSLATLVMYQARKSDEVFTTLNKFLFRAKR